MTVLQTTFQHQSVGKLKACCLCITTKAFLCFAYESWEKDDLTFHLLRLFSASSLKTWMYWPTQNNVDAKLVYNGLDIYNNEHLHPVMMTGCAKGIIHNICVFWLRPAVQAHWSFCGLEDSSLSLTVTLLLPFVRNVFQVTKLTKFVCCSSLLA